VIFTDALFFVFFALVFGVHWLLRGREARLSWLLLASFVFYGWWDWRFLGLIGFVILVSWFSAIRASGRTLGRGIGKWAAAGLGLWLGCSLVVTLGMMPVLALPVIGDVGAQLAVMTQASLAVAGVMAIALAGAALSVRLSHHTPRKVFWTAFAIISQLGVLALFKYAGFFADSAQALARTLGFEAGFVLTAILLPVGISFYVFQAISYVVDVARGDLPAQGSLRRVALYIAFFPQLVAGPIVRAASFFPQMERAKRLTRPLLVSAGRAFLLGLVYKAAIADALAGFVDPVFSGEPAAWNAASLAGATLAFGAQIYFDFAGYSLMAIGVARAFGYWIPRNFAYPYASTSLSAFWRRWHMSLSGWLRDYLYIPLGGNRKGEGATLRNLMVTMLLGGLWHGAAWTFVLWGALHGAGLVIERLARRVRGLTLRPALLGLILTQVFVILAWVPFRAQDFADTLTIWSGMIGLGAGTQALPWTVLAAPALIAVDAILGLRRRRPAGPSRPLLTAAGYGVLCALILALYPLEAAPFVYFQF
jgi:D-alanyl-lipoteichoic acid acyltransferase DltB (MBOAT superfamily)